MLTGCVAARPIILRYRSDETVEKAMANLASMLLIQNPGGRGRDIDEGGVLWSYRVVTEKTRA